MTRDSQMIEDDRGRGRSTGLQVGSLFIPRHSQTATECKRQTQTWFRIAEIEGCEKKWLTSFLGGANSSSDRKLSVISDVRHFEIIFHFFLDASSHLHTRVWPSVCPSVPPIGLSVTPSLCKQKRKKIAFFVTRCQTGSNDDKCVLIGSFIKESLTVRPSPHWFYHYPCATTCIRPCLPSSSTLRLGYCVQLTFHSVSDISFCNQEYKKSILSFVFPL